MCRGVFQEKQTFARLRSLIGAVALRGGRHAFGCGLLEPVSSSCPGRVLTIRFGGLVRWWRFASIAKERLERFGASSGIRCKEGFGRPCDMLNWIACNVILDESRLHSRRKGEVAKCFGAGGQPFQPLRGGYIVNPCFRVGRQQRPSGSSCVAVCTVTATQRG